MKPLRSFWRVFWSDRRAAAAAVFLLAEILLVLLLPLFLGQDPNVTDRTAGFWAPPSPAHLLGTDEAGRDLLSRLLAGGRVSLLVGFASAALGGVLGVPLGLLAGYKGGKWEYWIMRACDTFQSFPSILLVLAMVTLLGPSVWNIILVIGGSGSGKTRFFVKPNLMQCVSKDYPTSFVITDPKGSLIGEVGQLLIRSGYRVKVLNTINFSKSMKYNPFRYLHSEKDVLKLVNTLICNTKGEGEKSAEDFWVKAERLLYCALIGYIWYEAPAEEMNFTTLLELIKAREAREDDEEYQSPVDLLFADLEERSPDHFAVKQYKKYKLAAGKTAKSILISCGARLAPFDIEELRELMSYDELELDTLGDRKTALFLIMSDTDDTFNFVIAILQSQLFNLLCDKADDEYNGKLPIHVRFLLDEFANIGQIPRFDKLIATIRSREMSASIILQSQSQLKAIYKDAAEIILDNADSTLFLGGRGKNAKDISENLGRETIDSFNTSENRGTQVSHGLNYQKLGKELMTQDEIAVMDGGKCILQLRGVRPFFSDKYDITQHPNYKYLSDFDKKNAFDVERYMSTRPAIVKPDEPFDIYEIDLSDEDAAAE